MIENNLTFTANCVRFKTDRDGNDQYNIFSTYSVYFGEGDPGQDDHSWTFYRSSGSEYGIWTQRGREQKGLCEIIKKVVLNRSCLECVFNERGTTETGVNTLTILYDISEGLWQELAPTAERVFRGFTDFKLID